MLTNILISSVLYHNDTIMQRMAENHNLFQEIACRNTGQNLIFKSAGVTLEIRSRSPKSDQLFIVSQ